MRLRAPIVALALLAGWGAGCSPGCEEELPLEVGPRLAEAREAGVRPEAALVPERLAVATYNLGLARGIVPLAEERLEPVVAAVAELDVDVLCLQELWRDEDFELLRARTAGRFPHAYRFLTAEPADRSGEVACALAPVLAMAACSELDCERAGIAPEACIADACAQRYDALGEGCQRCLAANAASPTRCMRPGANPWVAAGRNGLALLSRHPIERPRYDAFDSVLVRRGVISAEIAGRTLRCTHLAPDLERVPYAAGRAHGSWAEEHRASVDAILAMEADSGCEILLGDLNAGPGGPSVDGGPALVPELAAGYHALLDGGYRRPWGPDLCTFCVENPLTGLGRDVAIDHVLARGCAGATLAAGRRLLDQPLELPGLEAPTRLSDHYAVAATLVR